MATTTINPDSNYPNVQVVEPVMSQLGYSLTLTPEITSGLPVKPIAITKALVAEVIKATPVVKENTSYLFGMSGGMIMMPQVGRNVYELTSTIINGRADCVGIYSYIQLMSVANSLITNLIELEGSSVTKPIKLTMRNSALQQRPDFLGIVAGSKVVNDIVSNISFMGTIDYTQTTIGDGLTNLLATLGNAFGVANSIANIANNLANG